MAQSRWWFSGIVQFISFLGVFFDGHPVNGLRLQNLCPRWGPVVDNPFPLDLPDFTLFDRSHFDKSASGGILNNK